MVIGDRLIKIAALGLKRIQPTLENIQVPEPKAKRVNNFTEKQHSKHYQENRRPKFLTLKQLRNGL